MSDVSGSSGARNPLLILAAVAAVAGVLVSTLLGRARRVVVHGLSMTPTLLPGDRLLVLPARRLRIGDVVAVPDPRQPERLLVKRVVGVDRDTAAVTVAGDNRDASTDSATFGPVGRQSVVGRAIYRYLPPERTGRIRRAPRAVNGARTTGEPPVTVACREAPVTHAGGTIPPDGRHSAR